MFKGLLALGKQAVDEHLLGLDQFEDLFWRFLCEQRIENDLSLRVVLKGLQTGWVYRIRGHVSVELHVKLVFHFFLEAESA